MLINNLNKIMATKNITVTDIFNNTHIARTSIMRIRDNQADKISMKIIDKICIFLEITPDEFFSFLPYNISIYIHKKNFNKIEKIINDLSLANKSRRNQLEITIDFFNNSSHKVVFLKISFDCTLLKSDKFQLRAKDIIVISDNIENTKFLLNQSDEILNFIQSEIFQELQNRLPEIDFQELNELKDFRKQIEISFEVSKQINDLDSKLDSSLIETTDLLNQLKLDGKIMKELLLKYKSEKEIFENIEQELSATQKRISNIEDEHERLYLSQKLVFLKSLRQ